MDKARPIKQVCFQEVARNNVNANTLESSSNSESNQTSSPSAEDICAWTHKAQPTAPCFIRDVYSMRESTSTGPRSSFYWLGHIPCQIVHIVGMVVGIDMREKGTLYTVDDSTEVIDCMLRHPGPLAQLDANARAALWSSRRRPTPSPVPVPPPPATAIGYPVEVIEACESTNNQWTHAITIVELHKSKYSVPKPFTMPVEVHPRSLIPSKCPLREPSSPLMHSAASKSSSFVIPGSTDPPQFRHPSQLRTADLMDETFQLYLQHCFRHVPGDVPQFDYHQFFLMQTPEQSTSGPITLSYLRRIPELALLASRRTPPDAGGEKAGQTQKSNISHFSSKHPHAKMKRLFMWAVLQLYERGSIVLYDGLSDAPTASVSIAPSHFAVTNTANSQAPSDVPLSSTIFSSPDAAKSVIPEDDAYLSDLPYYKEDEAYTPVTAALLAQPVRDIMCARGIRGKSVRVRAEDIAKDLKMFDRRWAHIDLRTIEEAIDTIVID
ncbi:uncharacterized protein F5147DRAFT_773827 [Suillus discolor]|uniref:CST complex subunit Stn1 N-terminal domain-containing protein n=1 Tax=Suillus discolor TaxID=1912936 RepID=A0A9P7JU06_9AGAM|nr:uncharacterized protein F5147DRAFT_773827 [Suillus discolor]KAG2108246.1 hypothetical protein F5147DRAFT_773827 [Suillus discolor]